ncbi:MAG: sulfatase-like hydrolase/transferase [Anaerohalosphaeraceae bacterium]
MKYGKTKAVFLICLIGAVLTAGFIVYNKSRQPTIRNVVLISMDTTRSDHLSCYGIYKNVTPNIDALANEGALFKHMYSPVPLTLPAHSSMLTGVHPPRHGVHDNLKYQLNDSNVTLAEILKDKGFATGAVISAFILDSRFGLDQGFDSYSDEFEEKLDSHISQRRGEESTKHAISWIDKNRDNPFFLFLHYYDPHAPYDPPEPFKSKILHPYFAEIAYTDHCIGQVIDRLKALGLYESTLIVVTADHGEMFGEHKEQTHGYFIYNGNIKVPLIIKAPGINQATVVEDFAGTVDIVPTICSLLGIDPPEQVQGKDLTPYLRQHKVTDNPELSLYSESMLPTKYGGNSLLGLITGGYKYIQTTRPELYDLINDPKESVNLLDDQSQRGRIMQDQLKQVLEESVLEEVESSLELDTEAIRRLESLGYLAGDSVEEEFSFDQEKTDPKDLIEYHTDMSKIQGMIQHEEFDQAEEICLKLIAQNNTETFPRLCRFMVSIAKKKNDYKMATKFIREVIELYPQDPSTYIEYGRALFELGDKKKASEQLQIAYDLQPESVVNCFNIAKAFYDGSRPDDAIGYCRKALEIDPDFILARTSLADTLVKIGKLEPAVEQYYEVLKRDETNLEALNALAWIQATYRHDTLYSPEEALRLALLACEINSQRAELQDTLAAAYAANRQFEGAAKTAQKAIELATEQGNDPLAGRIGNRLKIYQSGRSLRE